MKRNVPQLLRKIASEMELDQNDQKFSEAGLIEPIMPEENIKGGEIPERSEESEVQRKWAARVGRFRETRRAAKENGERIWKNSVAERVLKVLTKQPSTAPQLTTELNISPLIIKSICQYLLWQGYIQGTAHVSHRGTPPDTVYSRTKKQVEILEPPTGFTPAKSGLTFQKI